MDRRERIADEEETLRMAFDSQLANLWTALPAIVTAVDLGAMTLSAQPALRGEILQPSGEYVKTNMPVLVDVPIVFPSAGGFTLTLPIAAGDEVLIIFAARCIDAWWQSGGVQDQLEFRMHDLSDGFAIPGPRSQPKAIPSISSTNVQLRSDDGATFLEITPSGAANVTAPAGMTFTTPTATFTGAVIIGGVDMNGHTHGGVTPGSGSTGAPQ